MDGVLEETREEIFKATVSITVSTSDREVTLRSDYFFNDEKDYNDFIQQLSMELMSSRSVKEAAKNIGGTL
jgi:hypothetical protein